MADYSEKICTKFCSASARLQHPVDDFTTLTNANDEQHLETSSTLTFDT